MLILYDKWLLNHYITLAGFGLNYNWGVSFFLVVDWDADGICPWPI